MFGESKEELLEELYLLLLSKGPSSDQIEFWDPTLDAIILLEEIEFRIKSNSYNEEVDSNV